MKRIITAAALAAALLAGAPRAAAVCPYTVGPLGRYIAPAIVQGMTATDDGNAVEVWCTDARAVSTSFFASFFRGVVRGGRLESIAGHSFPRGVHDIPRHAFPGVGGGGVQILFNFFRDSN